MLIGDFCRFWDNLYFAYRIESLKGSGGRIVRAIGTRGLWVYWVLTYLAKLSSDFYFCIFVMLRSWVQVEVLFLLPIIEVSFIILKFARLSTPCWLWISKASFICPFAIILAITLTLSSANSAFYPNILEISVKSWVWYFWSIILYSLTISSSILV